MSDKKKQKVPGELIFGFHPLVELLKAKRRKLISIYTTKPTPKGWPQIEKLLPEYPVAIQYVARDILHRMAGTTEHQGFVAWVSLFPFRKKLFDPTKEKFLILLDGLQDPRNLGAVIRSAYCAGADGVIMTKRNSAPLNGAACKASAGLAEHMQIYQTPSAEVAAQELQKAGYSLYLAGFKGQKPTECEFKMPLCLVIGSEEIGITKALYRFGEEVTLPQRTSDISYNASVAAGILLYIVSDKHSILV